MDATPAHDRDANHRQRSPDRGPTLSDLISVAQGSQIVPSEPDDAMGAPSRTCRSLAGAINCPSVHSPLPEKDLKFLDGVIPQPPPGRDDTDWASLQETIYSEPTLPPSVSIKTNSELLQSPATPAVGITPVPSKKKFKFKDYDLDDDARYGCDSDNECGVV